MKLREKTVSRIASVILAAVMAVSMVPAAFAATTAKCDHVNQIGVDNGDGTCSYVCTKDGTVINTMAHIYEDRDGKTTCVRCGHEKVATDTSSCDHTANSWEYESTGHGTHKVICKVCKAVVDELGCIYVNGKCQTCGALEPACNHMDQHFKFVSNNNGTHNVLCADCNAVVSENVPCTYVDGKCTQCGAEKPACNHMGQHFKFVANNNGTHNVLCADCDAVVSENVPCTYVDGKCTQCGAEKPACDHMKNNWKYVDNGNGTHKVICKDCGKVVEEHAACVYTKGKCAACGHKKFVVTPGTDELDPSFSVSRYPICQFFQAVRQFFRSLFHRA